MKSPLRQQRTGDSASPGKKRRRMNATHFYSCVRMSRNITVTTHFPLRDEAGLDRAEPPHQWNSPVKPTGAAGKLGF